MSSLRALLPLEEKVAAERRRLDRAGGSLPRRTAAAAWAIAVLAHLAVLALPLAGPPAASPARAVRPDLPPVWRWTAPRPVEPPPVTAGPARAPAAAPRPAADAGTTVAIDVGPVAEPAPNVASLMLVDGVEALIPAPDPTAASADPALAPRPVGGAAPMLRRRTSPAYPTAARALGAVGSVTLEATILEDGTVGFARVLSSTRPGVGFEEAALLAVRTWLYDPAPPGSGVRVVIVTTDFQRAGARP